MGSSTIWECVVDNDLLLVKGSNMSNGEEKHPDMCAREGIMVGLGKERGSCIMGEAAGDACEQPACFTESCQMLQGEELERKWAAIR